MLIYQFETYRTPRQMLIDPFGALRTPPACLLAPAKLFPTSWLTPLKLIEVPLPSSLSTLLSLNLIPLFSINALSLSSPLCRLLPPKFTKIIWMFPHSGHQRVHVNRHMLFDFFNGLEETLQEGGEVYVTLTDGR